MASVSTGPVFVYIVLNYLKNPSQFGVPLAVSTKGLAEKPSLSFPMNNPFRCCGFEINKPGPEGQIYNTMFCQDHIQDLFNIPGVIITVSEQFNQSFSGMIGVAA